MEEKKLTDEEIVKELINESNRGEWCDLDFIDCVEVRVLKNAIDLINRQKAEIERLTSLYDGQTAFMTSSIGDLPLTVEGLRKAVDEISRLLTVQTELQELNAKYYNEAKDLRRENAELQKKVHELTDKLGNVLSGIKADELLVAKGIEHAVKDTAKEIYTKVLEWSPVGEDYHWFITTLENWLKEKYGVDMK